MKRTKVSTKMVKTYVGMIQKYRNKGIYYTVKLSHGPHARVLHHIPTCFNRFNTLMVTMVTKQTNKPSLLCSGSRAGMPTCKSGFLGHEAYPGSDKEDSTDDSSHLWCVA